MANTSCQPPCTTAKYQSVFTESWQGYGSGVQIFFDHNVLYIEKSFSITNSTIVEALGSALGLWLGLGILQLGEKLEEMMIKVTNLRPGKVVRKQRTTK